MGFDLQKHKYTILLIVVMAVALIAAAKFLPDSMALPLGKPSSTQQINYAIHVVTDHREVGLYADTDKLDFGWMPPGAKVQRGINVVNEAGDAKVVIKADGDAKDWIEIGNKTFNLPSGELQEVDLTVFVPTDAKAGNYTGTINVYFYR